MAIAIVQPQNADGTESGRVPDGPKALLAPSGGKSGSVPITGLVYPWAAGRFLSAGRQQCL